MHHVLSIQWDGERAWIHDGRESGLSLACRLSISIGEHDHAGGGRDRFPDDAGRDHDCVRDAHDGLRGNLSQ